MQNKLGMELIPALVMKGNADYRNTQGNRDRWKQSGRGEQSDERKSKKIRQFKIKQEVPT